jgi:4'-phosphopantetheinyl transferase
MSTLKGPMLGLSQCGSVHVWVVWLSARLRVAALLRGLSRVERKTARTFISDQARTQYIVSRFCIRMLASRYLGVRPQNIELHKTTKGQPRLMDPKGARSHRLNVSLSHCFKGVAIAFARHALVGVDLETHRQPPATTAAVARLLTGAERALTAPRQIWDCWARKEAFLKGM